MKFAVIKTGGKQYLVYKDDEIVIDNLNTKEDEVVKFDVLALGDEDEGSIELGKPLLKDKVKGKIIQNVKGEKIRVARFRAKSRYRKVKGFRPHLTKVKITSL